MNTGIMLALAAVFVVVTVHRLIRREFAVAAMTAGMGTMAIDMAVSTGQLVRGPWWALAFGFIAIWPLRRGLPLPTESVHHLVTGLTMVYMCTALPAAIGTIAPSSATALLTNGHAEHDTGAVVQAAHFDHVAGLALPLVGWLLATYFLLHAVGRITRRHAAQEDGRPVGGAAVGVTKAVTKAPARLALVDDVAMGLATAVMLLVMI